MPWLRCVLPALATAACRVYYRCSTAGPGVPARGPVLLVANHPNALLDPAMVAMVARRPVRFLAKAPLFTHPAVGWLVRAVDAIPVYRRQDDPTQMDRNADAFAAACAALAEGAAVALFPEGVSHSEPALQPLRTGAARIALGAAARRGQAVPLIPVGLVFRDKDRFRSEAHAITGPPVAWDDLAARGPDDHDAVRELTARVAEAIRAVTVNLARWEDDPLVRTAEAVWAAEFEAPLDAASAVARLRITTDALARLRASGSDAWHPLAAAVREHARLLARLRMTPAQLRAGAGVAAAIRRSSRRLVLRALAAGAVLTLGAPVCWVPYRLTGRLVAAMTDEPDAIATYRVLGGAVVFGAWVALLGAIVGWGAGALAGVAAALAWVPLALLTLAARDDWAATWSDLRGLALLRRDPRVAALRDRQAALAERLRAALDGIT